MSRQLWPSPRNPLLSSPSISPSLPPEFHCLSLHFSFLPFKIYNNLQWFSFDCFRTMNMNGTIICIHLLLFFHSTLCLWDISIPSNTVVVHSFALMHNVPLLNVPQSTNKFHLWWLIGLFVVFIIAMLPRQFLYLSPGTYGSLFL